MGLMDSFTSDAPVEVKQPDYYSLMREAAKAEIMLNMINAGVPNVYVAAADTGKIVWPDFTKEEEPEKAERFAELYDAAHETLMAFNNRAAILEMAEKIKGTIDALANVVVSEKEIREAEVALNDIAKA